MAVPAELDDYVDRAAARVREVLAVELAVVHAELEARIAEGEFRGSPRNIDPHHLTSALRALRESGQILYRRETTKGGGQVDTIETADRHRRTTAIEKAAMRKRALYARYNQWANASARYPRGLLGPAGERAARTAILASGTMLPAATDAGEVKTILGRDLRGPADSGGYMLPLSSQGIPRAAVTVLIEVKNIRSWVYPTSAELYQLLDKAASLQQALPDQPIVPVLICRRGHSTLFKMAKQLGFFVVETDRQWAGPVPEDDLQPVRAELRFLDLHPGSDPSTRVRERFTKTLPDQSPNFAATWASTCRQPALTQLIHQLRDLTGAGDRARAMAQLRLVIGRLGYPGGW